MGDEQRTILVVDSPATCRAAMAGLANSAGGGLDIAVGCDELDILALANQIDPPVADLISISPGENSSTRFAHVRQSPRCPHIDTQTGTIFAVNGAGELVAVTSRSSLDALYYKGSAAQARAQRSSDGMVERVQLASFGHYGIAVIACLLSPSADLYSWAAEHPDELAYLADPFISEWKFVPSSVQTQPGVLELRGQGDATGIIRITRAGCVLVGEMRRKLPGDLIGALPEMQQRLDNILGTLWRIADHAGQPEVVTRLICEGLRGSSLSDSDSTRFSQAKADALDLFGREGDSSDLNFRTETLDGFTRHLLKIYDPAFETA
jgi:hypothetical protein